MKRGLPRDTPVDTPALDVAGVLIDSVELGPDAEALMVGALGRAESIETIEAAYSAWDDLRRGQRLALRRGEEQRQRLSEHGSLLLGAVREATSPSSATGDAAIQQAGAGDVFLTEARAKLAQAGLLLDEKINQSTVRFDLALAALCREVRVRVARQAELARPVFKVALRVLAGERRILHARRLGNDESVVALFALTGRIPSRYGFLFDDSNDDSTMAPAMLYPDEGVTQPRPTSVMELGQLLSARTEVWPVKGMMPMVLADGGWARWVTRGAVLEAEIQDGGVFRNVLSPHEAERLTGLLLAKKLAGKIELELTGD